MDDIDQNDGLEPAVERDEHGFTRASSFAEWCDINEDTISKMMQEDPWELLSNAWYGGYVEGGRYVGEIHRKIYRPD